ADYTLLDPDTNKIVAVIEANYLTDLRTAAVSAVATKVLARPESKVLGIFGTGRQARAHALVINEVLPIRLLVCCGSDKHKSAQFAAWAAKEIGVDTRAATAEECVKVSDVICTCTTSKSPLFEGHLL